MSGNTTFGAASRMIRGVVGPLAVAFLAGALGAQEAPRTSGAETIDVELRTVPFYAVDERGRPVYDLEPADVELIVDGVVVEPDVFDRWALGNAEAVPAGVVRRDEPPPRHVLFFFDQAFLPPHGLKASQKVAAEILDGLGESDRLSLLSHHSRTGLRKLAGPVAADRQGKKRLRSLIDGLRPDVEFLRPSAADGLTSATVANQLVSHFEAIEAPGRAEYRATAENLAHAFQVLAAGFQRIRDPKLLLVFSGGVDSEFFFSGVDGVSINSSPTAPYHGAGRLSTPIHERFKEPLAALASSGVVPVFVNAAGPQTGGRSMLDHLSRSTGGLFLDSADRGFVERTVTASTAAYYELGIYRRDDRALDSGTDVEIRARRPGVRLVAPARLAGRQRYRSLSPVERRFAIADFVRGAMPTFLAGDQRQLEARVRGETHGDVRQLILELDWPEDTHGRRFDLFDVVLRADDTDLTGQRLSSIARRDVTASPEPIRLSTQLTGDEPLLWGVVAVEPETGDIFFRRLQLTP